MGYNFFKITELNLYLWEDTEVYEFWFLKEDEEY